MEYSIWISSNLIFFLEIALLRNWKEKKTKIKKLNFETYMFLEIGAVQAIGLVQLAYHALISLAYFNKLHVANIQVLGEVND